MPRLSDDLNNRLRGIIALVRLYREDPSFEKELNDVCKPYHSFFQQFALEYLDSHRDAIDSQDDDYQSLISNLKEKIGEQAADIAQIQACFHALDELACRWKLTIPMSGYFLLLSRVTDEVQFLGIKMRITPSFHPHLSGDIPPLKLGVLSPAFKYILRFEDKRKKGGTQGFLIKETLVDPTIMKAFKAAVLELQGTIDLGYTPL